MNYEQQTQQHGSNGAIESNEVPATLNDHIHETGILGATSTFNDVRDENSTERNESLSQRGVCEEVVDAFAGMAGPYHHSSSTKNTRDVSNQDQYNVQSIDENNEIQSEVRDEVSSAPFVPSVALREEAYIYQTNSVASDSSLISRLSMPNSTEASPNPNAASREPVAHIAALSQPVNSTPISSNHATLPPAFNRYQYTMNETANCLPGSAQSQNQSQGYAFPTEGRHQHEMTMPNGNHVLYHPYTYNGTGAGGISNVSTPNATIPFSPFLAFSAERGAPMVPDNLVDIAGRRGQDDNNYDGREALDGNTAKENMRINPAKFSGEQSRTHEVASIPSEGFRSQNFPAYLPPRFPLPFQHFAGHQNHLMFRHGNAIHASSPTAMTPPLSLTVPKSSSKKKRKAPGSLSAKGERQPQKRFSKDIGGNKSFGSKSNGKVRLTTNVPREVEVLNPVTRQRVYFFPSCSEASRKMQINRTKMSRTCRNGGGLIDEGIDIHTREQTSYFYRYTDMTEEPNDEQKRKELETITSVGTIVKEKVRQSEDSSTSSSKDRNDSNESIEGGSCRAQNSQSNNDAGENEQDKKMPAKPYYPS